VIFGLAPSQTESPVNQASTLPRIGDLVDGKFRIDRKLGEGGTSTVYEVSHVITDKKFAIKWLLPELALDDDAVDRFIHEARIGGRFIHPHSVQIYDICRANNSFYMLLDLLEGESLQARLDRVGRFSVPDACGIVLQCADILAAAHDASIVHRDLKPANIFLCAGPGRAETPRILDFGISKFCAELKSLSLVETAKGNVIGTPLYMSPEQMLGEAIGPRTDIYALGAVLYEMVSGRPPFHADSYADLVIKVAIEGKAQPLDRVAQVEPEFAAIVAKAMAQAPEDRFASVDELARAVMPYAPNAIVAAYRLSRSAPLAALSGSAKLVERVLTPAPVAEPRRAPVRARAALVALAGLSAGVGVAWTMLAHEPRAEHRVLPRSEPPAQEVALALPESAAPLWATQSASELFASTQAKPEVRSSATRAPARPLEPAAKMHREPKRAAEEPHAKKFQAQPSAASTPRAPAPVAARAKAPPDAHISRSDFEAPQPSAAPPRAVVSRRDF
jgi:tRNA A-37 threonylcarbamoyl transferase component Bud32